MTTGFGGALYVGDLGPEVTEANLFEIFNTVGPVASVRVCRDAATRRSLGYAYVNFHRVEDAEKALDVMNFKPIGNRACRVMWSQRDPSLRKSGVGNVFVKNLAPSIDNKTLFDTFSMFGNILSCKVVTDYTGKSLRYGFVHYETQEAADNAISRVDQKTIANEQVSVQPFKSKKERGAIDKQRYTNLYIRGFPFDVTAEELLELLGKHGKVTSHTVREYERKAPNSEEAEKLKYAFANYSSTEEAQAALGALDGTDWRGQKLYVARAQLRHEREKMLRERRERKIAENQQRYAGINVYVKNLPDTVDKNRLSQEFSKFGSITSAVVMLDSTTNKSRGFGFVCFTTPEEATQAISQMNGAILDGKPLYVALHQRKEVRKALLEAQFARQKYPPMYPGYMYGYPSRNFPAYPPQFMRRGWPAGQTMAPNYFPGQMPVPNAQQRSYQLMPAGPRPIPGAAGEPSPQRQRVPGGRQPAPGARGQQPRQPQQRRAQPGGAQAGRLLAHLQTLNPTQQKQFLGEKLFPLIQQIEPQQAGKITGMLLEMDAGEIIHLIEDDGARSLKVGEAMAVLQSAGVDE